VAEIVASAGARTAARVSGLHILAIQDTTSLRNDGDQRGMVAHPTIAVDAESGALLGLVHGQVLRREGGKKGSCTRRSFDEKESHRWLEGAEAAAGLAAAGVTVVADRESDIYALFGRRPRGIDLLVRSTHDRALMDGGKISARLSAMAAQDCMEVALPASPGRRPRTARLALRFCTVEIKRPSSATAGGPWSAPVNPPEPGASARD